MELLRQELVNKLIKQRKEIEQQRQQCNNFYVSLMEQSKKLISQVKLDSTQTNHLDLFNFL